MGYCWGCDTQMSLQGAFPDRSGAELLSYRDDLYVYGGMPTRLFAARFAQHPAWFKNDFPYMLKLNPTNCAWEPVSTKGLPKTWRWRNQSALARGQPSVQSLTSTATPRCALKICSACSVELICGLHSLLSPRKASAQHSLEVQQSFELLDPFADPACIVQQFI